MQNKLGIMWLKGEVFAQIEHYADGRYPLETGGILVGYVGDNNEPVVHAVVGAGPKALHLANRFEPDHAWQCMQLDDLFMRSAGQWVYMGDWHTHPNGRPKMSRLDRRTMRRISMHAGARISHPLMMIGGGTPNSWRWSVYCCGPARMFGFPFSVSMLELQLF